MSESAQLTVGDYIQLDEDVLFGPVVVLRVTHVYKNGNLRAKVFDDDDKVLTEVWKVHYSNVTKCKADTPPSKAWIEKICSR